MARSIATIKQQMIDAKNNEASLSGLTSTSQTAIWNLYFFIVATAINILEQIMDVFKSDIQTIVDNGVPNTNAWLQQMAFKFQYNATNPQILQLINLIPTYPTINEAYRIITRCSVVTDANRTAIIRVAKGTNPDPLSNTELQAFTSYVNVIGNAGIKYQILSSNADQIEIQGSIYYNAQYSAVIQTNVTNAINSYLSNLDFSGQILFTKIEDAIQSVAGVNDVKLTAILVRKDSDLITQQTKIYSLTDGINTRVYTPYAGYIKPETTTGHTLTDTLTFVVQ